MAGQREHRRGADARAGAGRPAPQRRRKQTTRQGRGRWRAPDLIGRDFGTDRLNHKWYGDGTEIPTDEGKLYLDSVLDMGSRRIVGFAIGEHHDADLAQAALQMAVAVRGGKDALSEVIMHTDQGSEYTAKNFRAACGRVGIKQSMGRVGSALDNAVIESWHSTVEFELRRPRALRHQGPGPPAGRGLDRGVQPRPAPLLARDAVPGRLRTRTPAEHRDQSQEAGSMNARSRAPSMAPSSPASRPRPPGGLRPALTPTPGDAHQQRPGAGRTGSNKSGLYGFRGLTITQRGLKAGDLLFATRDGTPISRNTFRTRTWLPAVKASGVDFDVRVHDLRHAHASWLLAGGSDLKSVMDRMGHAQITTTQKYLHTLPDADTKNLSALDRVRGSHAASPEDPTK